MTENATVSEIACGVFGGLVKSVTLADANPVSARYGILTVPLKCACPDQDNGDGGLKYLVTYPFVEWDDTKKVSEKFNVSVETILEINHLDPIPTVYPNTTILVPLKDEPFINFNFPFSDPPIPQFLSTMPAEKKPKTSHLMIKKLCIAGSVVGFCLVLALFIACGLYVKALKKFKAQDLRSSTQRIRSLNSCSTPISRSSTNSCLSPDLLAGIKYNLCMYNVEDLEKATRNFSRDSMISDSVYRGKTEDGGDVMIRRTRFEGTRQVIDVHSMINHVNIVKLDGVCYGADDRSWSYLIYEFPFNGSLRNFLSSGSSAALHWHRRTQIAFDIAMGLHYLHYSIVPAYIHLNINGRNIFLTANWRAKITVFGNAPCSKETEAVGWSAPEHVLDPTVVSEKVDIFSFGVVLLELISGKECVDGRVVRECITFLGGGLGNEGGCFDQLRKFVDPCVKDDYPIAEALCLAVLAGSCVEDEPLHRPSMDDVLKILARMV